MAPKTKAICQDSVHEPDFHFPYSNTVLSLRSIITASMSTEIIAQIGFPTPFAALWFKCPAMCCSQTARTLRPGAFLLGLPPFTNHLPPTTFSFPLQFFLQLPALPEIITQLAFLSSGQWMWVGGFSPHLIYIICASFCLLWSAPLPFHFTSVYLALLGTFCPCSVCILPPFHPWPWSGSCCCRYSTTKLCFGFCCIFNRIPVASTASIFQLEMSF